MKLCASATAAGQVRVPSVPCLSCVLCSCATALGGKEPMSYTAHVTPTPMDGSSTASLTRVLCFLPDSGDRVQRLAMAPSASFPHRAFARSPRRRAVAKVAPPAALQPLLLLLTRHRGRRQAQMLLRWVSRVVRPARELGFACAGQRCRHACRERLRMHHVDVKLSWHTDPALPCACVAAIAPQ